MPRLGPSRISQPGEEALTKTGKKPERVKDLERKMAWGFVLLIVGGVTALFVDDQLLRDAPAYNLVGLGVLVLTVIPFHLLVFKPSQPVRDWNKEQRGPPHAPTEGAPRGVRPPRRMGWRAYLGSSLSQ